MYKHIRILVVAGLSLFLLLAFSSGSIASPPTLDIQPVTTITTTETPAPVVQENGHGDNEVVNDSLLLEYGPSGGLITVSLGGVLMIIRAYNDGKKIEVTTYKDRYDTLRTTTDTELNNMTTKLASAQAEAAALELLLDTTREALETRKASFTQIRLANEGTHRAQIEELNSVLLQEIRIRHMLERILAEHGITLPAGTELGDTPESNTQG